MLTLEIFKKMFEIDLLEYRKKKEEEEKEQQRLSATDMALRGFKLAMEIDRERRKSDEEVIAILSAKEVEPPEPPQSTEEKLTKSTRKIQL